MARSEHTQPFLNPLLFKRRERILGNINAIYRASNQNKSKFIQGIFGREKYHKGNIKKTNKK